MICWIFPYETSERAFITEDKFINDLFILQPSLSLSPVLSLVLYEPARSIKLNWRHLILLTPFLVNFDSISRLKTEWDLELVSLYIVELTCFDFDPFSRI